MKTTIIFVLFVLPCATQASKTIITNLKCESFDPEFVIFLKCRLNVIKRGTVALNMYIKVLQLPVANITINFSIFKRANGYKPFLVNITGDLCNFMKESSKNLYFYVGKQFLLRDTNINHTCPFNHDVILKNFTVDENNMKLFPIPAGDYLFKTKVAYKRRWVFEVNAYMNRVE